MSFLFWGLDFQQTLEDMCSLLLGFKTSPEAECNLAVAAAEAEAVHEEPEGGGSGRCTLWFSHFPAPRYFVTASTRQRLLHISLTEAKSATGAVGRGFLSSTVAHVERFLGHPSHRMEVGDENTADSLILGLVGRMMH